MATVPSPPLPSHVFISYAREDRETAQLLATALIEAGLSVWWDRQIAGGQDFADVIAEQLGAARVALVLWSRASVASTFVRDEAATARDAGKLLPLRIEDVRPPLGFGTIQTLDLLDWDGDRDDPAWLELLAQLRREPGQRASTPVVAPRRPWRRWRLPLIALVVLALVGGAAVQGWRIWREQQALTQLQNGLNAHFARDRNLQAARNAYLSALRIDPELGRAYYYLGHVYALLILPRDARAQFLQALRFARDLDEPQREDTQAQLAALRPDEAEPVTREAVPIVQPAPAAGATPPPSRPSLSVPPEDRAAREAAAREAQTRTAELSRNVEALRRLQETSVLQLPRVAPSPEQQRQIEAQVDALFAPLAQTRLSAASALALDPALAADALPLALDRALAALSRPDAGEAQVGGATNTVQLLLAASPATLRAHADDALRLAEATAALGANQRANAAQLRSLVEQSRNAKPPRAYIQIADAAQRALAQGLAARIRASGYDVPAIELVGARAPARSEVRSQGGSAPGWGRWLAKLVSERGGEPARLSSLRSVRPGNDTFEIWLDKDLCVTRHVPACDA